MSTEAKKAEALSSEEMSSVVDGSKTSSNGTPGGGEFIVGKMAAKLSDAEMLGVAGGASRGGSSGGAEFLVDPEQTPRRLKFLVDPEQRESIL